jgi:drug/metabolite transporter (DMT)-like permease
MTATTAPATGLSARALVPVVVLTLVWGSNWPILKLGVSDVAPLTFRAFTLGLAALGMFAVAKLSGESIAVPRALWGRMVVLALLNISGWNGLLLFGLQQLPAGRSAILAYTMPLWSMLFSLVLLHEPLSPRRIVGLVLGMLGMALLLGEDIGALQRTPTGAALILGSAMSWGLGVVMLRKWKPPLPPNALTGWTMLIGWVPLVLAAPLFSPWPALSSLSGPAWFAIVYNIVLAGTLAHWAWFTLARTLPIAVSSMSSLPVPIFAVFAGILVLGERPGIAEWVALGLVLAAMVAVLWPPKPAPTPLAPDD